MVRTRVKFDGKKVTLRGVGFGRYQMLALGRAGLKSVKKRLKQGLGAHDNPMPPLSPQYERRKRRSKIRDLELTGAMLDNLSVRWSSGNQVNTALTARKARKKALSNQKISWWLAYSPSDQRAIAKRARELFKAEVGAVRASLVRGRRYRRGVRRAA